MEVSNSESCSISFANHDPCICTESMHITSLQIFLRTLLYSVGFFFNVLLMPDLGPFMMTTLQNASSFDKNFPHNCQTNELFSIS